MNTFVRLFRLVVLLSVSVLAARLITGCFFDKKEPQPRQLISGPVPFKYSVIDANPNTGKDCCMDVLALGDINGDGFLDVVIGAQEAEADGLVWYEHPLWKKHPVASGEFTTDGKTADVNGDGLLDIVIGDLDIGLVWFKNPGEDAMGPWARQLIGEGYVHDVEAADMDGDGDWDIVTCDKKAVVLWRQEAPDRWTRIVLFEKKGEGLALADMNRDGRMDVVIGGVWLEAPNDPAQKWTSHVFSPNWPADTRVAIADMNKDGRLDVVLSASEGRGTVSWFEAPEDPRQEAWKEHPVTREALEGAHSLQVADMDRDGDLDIVVAEMHTTPKKRVIIYLQTQNQWTPAILSERGSHNLLVADIDGDSDSDIVGKNYAGPGRAIEYWENLAANKSADAQIQSLHNQQQKWQYIAVDSSRPENEKSKMGLVFADVNNDGFQDIIAGSLLYLNPDGEIHSSWERVQLLDNVDVHFAVRVDENPYANLVGIKGNEVIWLQAQDISARSWKAIKVATVPDGRVQGYVVAQLAAGRKPQLVFTKGHHLMFLRIPGNVDVKTSWDLVTISEEVEETGIAIGDIDGDGDLDIAAVARDGHHAVWFENPGSRGDRWRDHKIGTSSLWIDRLALADVNNDGRLDLIATEENRDGYYKARLYWFEAPSEPKASKWVRHSILALRSINSMDVTDMNGDGVADIVIAEHTDLRNGEWAADNVTAILYNRGNGAHWDIEKVEVDQHSSHLGAQTVDLDNDGSREIVSIGWEQYCCLHLWMRHGRKAPVATAAPSKTATGSVRVH